MGVAEVSTALPLVAVPEARRPHLEGLLSELAREVERDTLESLDVMQAPAFEKAPVWQYLLAELLTPAPCPIDKLLRDINR